MNPPAVRFHVLTLFPGMFKGPLTESILQRAQKQGIIKVHLYDIREHAHDRHRTADDYPFGGGPGMVMKPEPIFEAVEDVVSKIKERSGQEAAAPPVILLSPQGRSFTQAIASDLSIKGEIILICGHYEGVDHRVVEHLCTDEISIGDYILTGGELPAMVLIDAVARLVPGALGNIKAGLDDSFTSGLLQYPQYTRPERFRDMVVPPVLLSGNHTQVERWRRGQALKKTLQRRPDLLEGDSLSSEDRRLLEELR